jgi:hypothetical protein
VTPVPLDLPVRPSEAGELANLIFDHAERQQLTDELRNRLAARAAILKLETITPYFGSLARDPVHPSAYYLAVDGAGGSPQLLYLALSTAPTSSIFHQPLLIGRMRRVNGPEFVINAIPFGSEDRAHLDAFVSRIDAAFLPRPQGARAEIVVDREPAAAFEVFRAVHKRTGRNLAGLACGYGPGLWAAIRAGWRQGYASVARLGAGASAEETRAVAGCSRFAVDVSALEAGEPAWRAAAQIHEQIRQARAALKLSGAFEWEAGLPGRSVAELEQALGYLQSSGHAVQFAAPAHLGADVAEAAAAARRHQAMLSVRYDGQGADWVKAIAEATLGKVSIPVKDAGEAMLVAEHLLS